MASRGDMIRRARRRVDARREARNRANIRDQARANYGRNLGKRKFAPTKAKVGRAGDVILDTARGIGGDFKKLGTNVKDAFFPVFQKAMQGIGSLGDNWQRSSQNRKILGDVYTDDLRKSMMTDDDLKFYNKYMKLGDMRSGQEAQYYYDEANKALQNAQITNRINYALGQPEFGFETTAPAGVANIDYSTLVDRMVGGTDDSVGLEGTAAGQAFLDKAYKEAAKETGGNLIGDEIINTVAPTGTGQSMVADLNPRIPYQDASAEDVSEYDLPPELFIDESQNMTDVFNDYGGQGMNDKALMDTMGAFYEGASAGSPYDTGARSPLYGIFPNYEPGHPILSPQLEDLDEQGLLDWGVENPNMAEALGFNPYYSNMWLENWLD